MSYSWSHTYFCMHACIYMYKKKLEICKYINLCVYVAKDINTFMHTCIIVHA